MVETLWLVVIQCDVIQKAFLKRSSNCRRRENWLYVCVCVCVQMRGKRDGRIVCYFFLLIGSYSKKRFVSKATILDATLCTLPSRLGCWCHHRINTAPINKRTGHTTKNNLRRPKSSLPTDCKWPPLPDQIKFYYLNKKKSTIRFQSRNIDNRKERDTFLLCVCALSLSQVNP